MSVSLPDPDSLDEVAAGLATGADRGGGPAWITAPRELDRMIRRLDFASMRSLEAVCEHGSISRAAQVEALTASAISKRIKELEAVLGVELLRRSHDGIRPSRAGRVVLQHWIDIKARMYTLAESVRAMPSDATSRLVLVCDERLFDFLCVDLFARPDLFELARHVDVVPTSRDVADTVAALEADIGVAIAPRPGTAQESRGWAPVDPDGASRLRFSPTAYVAICRKDHPLAGAPAVTAASLAQYDVWPLGGSKRVLRTIEEAAGVPLCTDRMPRWLRLSNALSILDSVELDAVLLAPVSIRWQCPRYENITVVDIADRWAHIDVDVAIRARGERLASARDAVARIFG